MYLRSLTECLCNFKQSCPFMCCNQYLLIIVLLEHWPLLPHFNQQTGDCIIQQVSCYFTTGRCLCVVCWYLYSVTFVVTSAEHMYTLFSVNPAVKHLAFFSPVFQIHQARQNRGRRRERKAGLLTADGDRLPQNILFFLAKCTRTSGLLEQCAIRPEETLPHHWTIGANWRFARSTCRRLWIGWKEFWQAQCYYVEGTTRTPALHHFETL